MLELGNEKRAKCLEVKVAGEVYYIPTAKNLPLKFGRRLTSLGATTEERLEFFFDFFGAHLGDAMDALDMEDFRALINAWREQGEEDGANLGE